MGLTADNLIALAGIVVGGIAGYFIKWAIDKKQNIEENRRAAIKRWREYIDSIEGWHLDSTFQDSSIYSEIKPYLKEEVAKLLEIPRGGLTLPPRPGIAVDVVSNKQLLLDEITRIEREVWKLI